MIRIRGAFISYLLHIDSSSLGTDSVSRQVAGAFRDSWRGPVIHRDLGAAPVPHLTAAGIASRSADKAARTPEQAAAAAVQEELIEEFLGASAYLFTVPMYNYSIPSVFKAWRSVEAVKDRDVGESTHGAGPGAASACAEAWRAASH